MFFFLFATFYMIRFAFVLFFFFFKSIKFQSVLVLSDAEPCWFVSVTQSETDLEPEHQLNEIKYLP